MGARSIAGGGQVSSCYFRTTADGDSRKALVQIDERCNLRCAHCFVSATKQGQTIGYDDIVKKIIPRLASCRVDRVTLTGGEPTIHPQFLDVIRAFRSAGMGVGVCTNATTLSGDQIAELAEIGRVHCNVSLDGFRPESHGKFRGDRDSFHTTIATIKALAKAGLLQGLLCTPNSLAEDIEYRQLCQFAVEHRAEYVLMNPLSPMGRGVRARRALAATEERMLRIHQMTDPFDGPDLDVVRIRFPNTAGKPLAGCAAGTIIYVFALGEVTVCPYLVFAAKAPQSQHDPAEFIVGNILTDPDIADRLDAYNVAQRLQMGTNPTCRSCSIADSCEKGCPAAVIAAGKRVGEVDRCRGLPDHHGRETAVAADARMNTTPLATDRDRLSGMLITIDGPGGVGKSTTAQLLAKALDAHAITIPTTTEPTRTSLGEHIRAGTDTYRGMALACLGAGDRHHHLATEILPALQAGKVVICDRYLPSSLVLQGIDGIESDTVWRLNARVYIPDVAVVLNADHPVIADRLRQRGAHSRFERQPGGSRVESDLYHSAAVELRTAGWPVMALDCTIRRPETIAMMIAVPVMDSYLERSQACPS